MLREENILVQLNENLDLFVTEHSECSLLDHDVLSVGGYLAMLQRNKPSPFSVSIRFH
jgi:hypothetical protein